MLGLVRGVGLVVSVGLLGTAGAAAQAPEHGAAGIGDPYFPTSGNGGYRVQHYDITAGYVAKTRRLRGDTTIKARATQDLSRLNLDLLLRASEVRVDGHRAKFRQTRHELIVTPRHTVPDGTRFTVRVRYAGRPGTIEYADERPFIASKSGALAVGQPNIAAWWFPSNDHPSDKARFDIALRVAEGRQTVSNGRLVSAKTRNGRTTWRWHAGKPMATYLAFAGWGGFAIERGHTRSGRPYLYAYDKRLGTGILETAKRSLHATGPVTGFLSKRWGRYPYRQIGGVVTAAPLGYALENQTRPVYDRVFFAGVNRGVVVHEMAHQWFGDAIALKRWRDIWLNEGYATYSEWIWAAQHGGRTPAQQFDDLYDLPATDHFWSLPIGNPGAHNIFAGPIYTRGAMALHALRREIGSEAFFDVSRRWVHRNADGVGSTNEYRRLAEEVSGKDLGPLFSSWLGPGKPEV
ncbi:M1 family metallopeptidase [Solicola gregarius]|uniref:Aminopeptidase N n=1 Tax=Solicola gregarius TaxID=2908642 RepID=A0AA46TFC4_9ACTN|nr:M1 family metallopeptidase [Solicola gregarius]UYM04115.1 M1 family metallopeptidase [Solicola gregarius]